MAILNVDNEYSLFLTDKCNWNCPYCAIRNPVDKKRNVSFDYIKEKINSIPEQSNVTLYGGEPGLVFKEHMYEYFNMLLDKKCNIYVETNGKFIQNFPELVEKCKEVIYHCSENLDYEKDIPIYIGDNIRYMIVVNDYNIKMLDKFLKKYNNITFDIIEATYPHMMNGITLSKKNKFSIMRKYNKRMTEESIKRLITPKDFEKIIYL